MRIDELVLNNVGPYRGEQRANLRPASPDRPVILFGGLNGAGKTTILEGIQLALYGNLSEPVRRSGLAYDEYLRRSTNRSSPSSEGSAVEVTFTVHESGKPKEYRLRRCWSLTPSASKKAKEVLDIWVDGEPDPPLCGLWPEHVAQFLPPRLAPLFFFDGERIEQLADPEQSAGTLRTAVGALLGADLVDQLHADLDVLLKRRQVDRAAEQDDRVPAAENALDAAEEARQVVAQAVADARSQLDRAEELLKRADRRYSEQGGRAADDRRENEKRLEKAVTERRGVEQEMRTLAAGSLPLALLSPLIKRTEEQLEKAGRRSDQRVAAHVLRDAADRLEAELTASKADPNVMEIVREWAANESYVPEHSRAAPPDAKRTADRLAQLRTVVLPAEIFKARELAVRHAEAAGRADDLTRTLSMTPDADAVREAASEREEALMTVGAKREALANADERLADATVERDRRQRDFDKLLAEDRLARGEEADAARFNRHAGAARAALARFGSRLRRRHLERLEKLVLECFRSLLRKTELARGLSIDPKTYALSITNSDGEEVRAERLSAGERQLLAVAMLWAMARASGRPLPVVVDTPLGRLDGVHRRRLAERYFPHAAGQVILLSTDEEIDVDLYASLAPHMSRAFHLDHDERGGTVIKNGYPFGGHESESVAREPAEPRRSHPAASRTATVPV
ncbi:DNA sulfur modification protein DndD [Alienimonas californiensis]|uniref:Chromosome segregation protein n=1 Tax=Alienimonas californiensis TaxID=2527989 RepID=A0A517PBQ0_9PLAN|nr:DNA sulfur modification protein DndD [Alienimonas californiensis]QDT16789.1 chromosome segregation protein [Alienimonas californiensis]